MTTDTPTKPKARKDGDAGGTSLAFAPSASLRAFQATLPADPERERLAAALEEAHDRLGRVWERARAVRAGLAASASTSGGIDGLADGMRQTVIAERGALVTEASMLPLEGEAAAQAFAVALCAWATHVRRAAQILGDQLVAELQPKVDRYARLRNRLDNMKIADSGWEGVNSERREVAGQMAPARERLGQVNAALVALNLSQWFGDAYGKPPAASDIARFVRRTRDELARVVRSR